jgi:hypothetical protein
MRQNRDNAHTLAHLGAMRAAQWGLRSHFDRAGLEIDADPTNVNEAEIRTLPLRHLIEQLCTDVLRRIPRAFGPFPLAMDEAISLRYQELDLYLRQSHAERDLERLGKQLRQLARPEDLHNGHRNEPSACGEPCSPPAAAPACRGGPPETEAPPLRLK